MRKKALSTVVVVLILSSLLFQGCGIPTKYISLGKKYTPLNKRDLTTLAPLRIASYVRPDKGVYVWHSRGETTGTVVGIFSPIGGAITSRSVRKWERALREEIIAAGVPRYYELVMKKFCERANKEIPGWPPMVMDEQPVGVGRDYIKNLRSKSSPLLLLLPAYAAIPQFSTAHGFGSKCRAVLYDSESNLLWVKDFEYSSEKYGRHRSIEEYKADNFKFLKEEMEFAAETTVSAFIESILQESGSPKRYIETEREQEAVSPEKSSQEQTLQEEVSNDYGILSITTDPPGAKVFIDGEYKGQTPAEMSLNTGTYQLFIENKFYEPYTDSLTIEKDQTKTLNIKLTLEGEE
jgi:hypothetical protein